MNIFDPVLEFSRLMQVEYRPQIESLMIDGNSSNELGPNPETLEPLLRAAFEAGLKFWSARPDQLTPPRVDNPTQEQTDYDPNCILCRRNAGKADAGLSENDLCHDHLVAALREAQSENQRLQKHIEEHYTGAATACIRRPRMEAGTGKPKE